MGVFSNNRLEISPNALISASHISDLYDVLTGNISEDLTISGSLYINSGEFEFISSSGHALHITESHHINLHAITASISNLTINNLLTLNTSSLPTSDPNITGVLWRTGSYLMISLG